MPLVELTSPVNRRLPNDVRGEDAVGARFLDSDGRSEVV